MHYKNFSGGAPTPLPTYSPKIWRNHSAGVDWNQIELSDGVFTWTTMDAMVAYFDGQGQDIYYQLYGCPASARISGATWTSVPDQDGSVGAGCVPDQIKLARFVTALLTRYPQIKWLSPWNETKWGNPVVKFPGTLTGTLVAGDAVTGLTSGATGTVVSCTSTLLLVRLSGPAYSATPFSNAETIQKDASNKFVNTTQNAVHYWFGTKEQLVTHCQAVFSSAKAVRSSIIVTTPDFVEGSNVSGEEEWLATWMDAGGTPYFDALAYHFYNYDIRPTTKSADAYSIIQRCEDLDLILSARGRGGVPKIASEAGFTSGWSFWAQQSDRASQAATIKRVSAYLAARGWQGVIWYDHTEEYVGAPSANAVIANALDTAGKLSGNQLSGAYVAQDNSLRMLSNGVPVIF